MPAGASTAQKVATLISGSLLVAPWLAVAGPVAIVVGFTFPVILVPLIGYQGMSSYLERYVLRAEHCQGNPHVTTSGGGSSVSALPCMRWIQDGVPDEGLIMVSTPSVLVARTSDGQVMTLASDKVAGLKVVRALQPEGAPLGTK